MEIINFGAPNKEYGWLSISSVQYPFYLEGVKWPSVLHWIIAQKYRDPAVRELIRKQPGGKKLAMLQTNIDNKSYDDIKFHKNSVTGENWIYLLPEERDIYLKKLSKLLGEDEQGREWLSYIPKDKYDEFLTKLESGRLAPNDWDNKGVYKGILLYLPDLNEEDLETVRIINDRILNKNEIPIRLEGDISLGFTREEEDNLLKELERKLGVSFSEISPWENFISDFRQGKLMPEDPWMPPRDARLPYRQNLKANEPYYPGILKYIPNLPRKLLVEVVKLNQEISDKIGERSINSTLQRLQPQKRKRDEFIKDYYKDNDELYRDAALMGLPTNRTPEELINLLIRHTDDLIMRKAIETRIRSYLILQQMLLLTGDAQLHFQGNHPYGVGRKGEGDNIVGRMIERIREELKKGQTTFDEEIRASILNNWKPQARKLADNFFRQFTYKLLDILVQYVTHQSEYRPPEIYNTLLIGSGDINKVIDRLYRIKEVRMVKVVGPRDEVPLSEPYDEELPGPSGEIYMVIKGKEESRYWIQKDYYNFSQDVRTYLEDVSKLQTKDGPYKPEDFNEMRADWFIKLKDVNTEDLKVADLKAFVAKYKIQRSKDLKTDVDEWIRKRRAGELDDNAIDHINVKISDEAIDILWSLVLVLNYKLLSQTVGGSKRELENVIENNREFLIDSSCGSSRDYIECWVNSLKRVINFLLGEEGDDIELDVVSKKDLDFAASIILPKEDYQDLMVYSGDSRQDSDIMSELIREVELREPDEESDDPNKTKKAVKHGARFIRWLRDKKDISNYLNRSLHFFA